MNAFDLKFGRTKHAHIISRLEELLDNQYCFRDYEIKYRHLFGKINKVAVHQCVDDETMERDIENALHSFSRDGFGCVVFYV